MSQKRNIHFVQKVSVTIVSGFSSSRQKFSSFFWNNRRFSYLKTLKHLDIKRNHVMFKLLQLRNIGLVVFFHVCAKYEKHGMGFETTNKLILSLN